MGAVASFQVFLIGALMLLQFFETSKTQVIIVYTEINHKGTLARIRIKTCSILPVNVSGLVSSIDTAGNCARLFEEHDCSGESVDILANTPMHHDLSQWDFDNKAKSVGPCQDSCDPNVTGLIPEYPFQIQLETFWFGYHSSVNINVYGCTLLPPIKFDAIFTNETCVQIYNNKYCESDKTAIDTKSIELRPKTPHHLHFSEWSFPNAVAISHCAYKCISRWSNKTRKEIGYQTPVDLPTKHRDAKEQNTIHQTNLISTDIVWVLVIVPLVSVVVSLVVVLFVLKKCQSQPNAVEIISENEINEFRNGLAQNVMINDTDIVINKSRNDYSVELSAINKPYDEAYEIPRHLINFDTKDVLGSGQFGMVFKGSMRSPQDLPTGFTHVPVAVKMCRPGSGAHCFRSLLKEVKVMIFVGKHDHVASLVGCCTENLSKGEVLVLVEYCSNGSLESYLHKNQSKFINIVYKGRIQVQKSKALCFNTLNIENTQEEGLGSETFDFFQMSRWCSEIARGMEFLSCANVVHSDLASRNILLTDKLTAKISDFGLSRQLYNYTEYVKKNQEPLPWRWMAPESLKKLEFSTKSDVWSYGILCWEIFTLGEKPYSGMAWCASFISSLEDGLKLEKPKYSTTEIYNLMLNCWKEEPMSRPTFTEISESLQEIHNLY